MVWVEVGLALLLPDDHSTRTYMIPDPIGLGPGSAKDTLCVLAIGRCVVNDGVFKTGV